MHIMLDLNSAKLSRHLIQAIVVLYASLVFSDNKEAILLYSEEEAFPIPPVVEKTAGTKDECSTILIRSSYALLFAFSCRV